MGQRDPYGLQDAGHPMAGMLSTMSSDDSGSWGHR